MKYKKQVLGVITSCDPYTTESIVQIIWYEFKNKYLRKQICIIYTKSSSERIWKKMNKALVP